MISKTYQLKTKHRTLTMIVEEYEDRVEVRTTTSLRGMRDDAQEIWAWHCAILAPYDEDDRALLIDTEMKH
jgi:hypothetical protein